MESFIQAGLDIEDFIYFKKQKIRSFSDFDEA